MIGTAGGTGYVIEFRGKVFEDMTIESRLTVCNMSIEGGARAGLIAPDDNHLRLCEGPPICAQGRGMGPGGGLVATLEDRSAARLSTRA